MENENNIVLMCKDCSNERRNNFQNTFDKYSLEVGNMIKKDFIEGKESEHMWVQIVSITKTGIKGLLANEPFVIKNLKLGDKVIVKFTEIEDIGK